MYNQSFKASVASIFCICFATTLVYSSSAVNFVLRKQPSDVVLSGNSSDSKGRIVNGLSIDIRQAPYFVQLTNPDRKLFCGGTLVSPSCVITAAHCVQNMKLKFIKVAARAPKINGGGEVRKVVLVEIHPEYNPNTWHADVAVLKVDIPFPIDRRVKSILMCPNNLKDGEKIDIIGWGKTKEYGLQMAEKLQSIGVKGMSYEKCFELMKISETMVCSAVSESGQDACQGDSGGPAISVTDHCLMGIVSWGQGCGRKGIPGVLTSVSKVRSFIRKIRQREKI